MDEGFRPLICEICRVEWADDGSVSTFYLFCPVCGANLVHEARTDPGADPPWW